MSQPPSAGERGPTSNKRKSCSQQRTSRRHHTFLRPFARESVVHAIFDACERIGRSARFSVLCSVSGVHAHRAHKVGSRARREKDCATRKTQHDAIGTFTRPNSICAQVRLSMQPPHLVLVLLRQILSHDLLAEGAHRRDALRRCCSTASQRRKSPASRRWRT